MQPTNNKDKEQGSESNPDNLTLEEAKQLAREGHKVRHVNFTSDEYMEYKDGWNGKAFYFEDDVYVTPEWFHSHWLQHSWSIHK